MKERNGAGGWCRGAAPLARRALAALALAAALGGCSRDERPNLVLVTLDTTRADRIGAYGDTEASTPNLDAFARRATLFTHAYASAPLTLPSHTTMLTGLDPLEHGVHDNGQLVPSTVPTVTERLAAAGYGTGAFVAAYVLDGGFGLSRGFEYYDDDFAWEGEPLAGLVPHRDGAQVTAAASEWLAERGRGPFFLWAHYFDVHEPRRPPPPYDANPDPYAGALSYVDAQVGRLLAAVEKAARGRPTLVVIAADHGESLGEHEEMTHGVVAYDSTLHVPLLAAGPGFPAGARSEAFVGTRDVAATLLAAAGLEAPPGTGRALALQDVAAGRAPAGRTDVFVSLGPARRFGWAPITGVRDARFKYTAEPAPPELYDVIADPGETHDLVAEAPDVVARLAAVHRERISAAAEPAAAPEDEEIRERLAALGYASAPAAFAPDARPDPRRLVGAIGWIEAARARAAQGRVADSIRALEILASSPAVRLLALRSLAPVYARAGRVDDAVRAYRELVEGTRAEEFRVGLASAQLQRGDARAALAALDEANLGREGRPMRAALLRAQAHLMLGESDAAIAVLERALAEHPRDDAAQALLALARADRGDPAAQIAALQREIGEAAARNEPTGARSSVLAELLGRVGRLPEAARVLTEAGEENPQALAGRARIAASHRNPRLAAELYEQALERRPSEGAWRRALADLERELGRDDRAGPLYDELIAAAPDDPELRLARGAVRFRQGRLDEAHEDFARAAELAPDLPQAHLNLALVALRQGRSDDAERHLLRALELRPDYGKAHFHLARIYHERGDPRAAEHAERAAALSHQEENGSR